MSITATELKNNLGKYLLLSAKEDVFITKNGKFLTKIKIKQKIKYELEKTILEKFKKNTTMNEAKEERLGAK